MSALIKLAERIEAATGPDRELDAAIFREIGAPLPTAFAGMDVDLAWDDEGQCFIAPCHGMRVRYEQPAYTASLDAAMMLVPPDSWLDIKGPRKYLNIPTPVPNRWSASVSQWNHGGEGVGWGATPALALTAAALRARAAVDGGGE